MEFLLAIFFGWYVTAKPHIHDGWKMDFDSYSFSPCPLVLPPCPFLLLPHSCYSQERVKLQNLLKVIHI